VSHSSESIVAVSLAAAVGLPISLPRGFVQGCDLALTNCPGPTQFDQQIKSNEQLLARTACFSLPSPHLICSVFFVFLVSSLPFHLLALICLQLQTLLRDKLLSDPPYSDTTLQQSASTPPSSLLLTPFDH
jgi:hypothetical protein